jgi:hypothetical protein
MAGRKIKAEGKLFESKAPVIWAGSRFCQKPFKNGVNTA